MGDLFFQLGRRLGHAAIPAVRKTRWAWRLLTGSEQESIEAEREMGEAMAREVPTIAPGTAGAGDVALLDQIGRDLTMRLRNKERKINVCLTQGGNPNAFSLPGGYIFVDVSFMELCRQDKDALAFVLAHEIAHVVRRHTMDRWLTGVGINMISMMINRGSLGAWWQQKGKELLRSAYSHEQEREADEFGFRLARAAGYDPAGCFRLLALLNSLRSGPLGLGEHLASHPPEAHRIAVLEQVRRKCG
jgi:beta-barrel assembly-enhancing protease